MDGDEIVRPPRWAEALLRTCLSPEEAETQSGDLLETYRDSIYLARGPNGANLWYLRQVAWYLLRPRTPRLGAWILAGLALSGLIIVVSLLVYPGLLPQPMPLLMAFGILFFGCTAVIGTRVRNSEDAAVLRLGARYGLVMGTLGSTGLVAANLQVAPGLFPFFLTLFLPLIAGAHGAIKLWKVRAGLRVGYWSGLIHILILFLALMALGYTQAFVPGFPGAEIPKNHPYTAFEYQRLNVEDVLEGGFVLAFFGVPFSLLCGALGGFAGLLLARTGRGNEEPRRIPWR